MWGHTGAHGVTDPAGEIRSQVQVSNPLLKSLLFLSLQLDHYPSVSYHLPSSSDTLFNSPKSLFLGKVIGKNSVLRA